MVDIAEIVFPGNAANQVMTHTASQECGTDLIAIHKFDQ